MDDGPMSKYIPQYRNTSYPEWALNVKFVTQEKAKFRAVCATKFIIWTGNSILSCPNVDHTRRVPSVIDLWVWFKIAFDLSCNQAPNLVCCNAVNRKPYTRTCETSYILFPNKNIFMLFSFDFEDTWANDTLAQRCIKLNNKEINIYCRRSLCFLTMNHEKKPESKFILRYLTWTNWFLLASMFCIDYIQLYWKLSIERLDNPIESFNGVVCYLIECAVCDTMFTINPCYLTWHSNSCSLMRNNFAVNLSKCWYQSRDWDVETFARSVSATAQTAFTTVSLFLLNNERHVWEIVDSFDDVSKKTNYSCSSCSLWCWQQ